MRDPLQPELILAGRVITGVGNEVLGPTAVEIVDGAIASLEPLDSLGRTRREGRRILDAGDSTLIPGLIDTHVHLTFTAGPNHGVVRKALEEAGDATLGLIALANAQAHLRGGVTTVRDVGGRGFVALEVRDTIARGVHPGPRILAAGPAITTRTGHLHYLRGVAEGAEAVRARAREILDRGADLVKICATGGIMTEESDPMACQYTAAELSEAVNEARRRGRDTAAHVLTREGVRRCLEAGVRSLEHCALQTEPGEYRFDPELARKIIEGGSVAGLTFAGISQARYREEVLGRHSVEDMGAWRGRMERRYVSERAMIDAGVPYVLHSDAGVRETPFGEFWLVLATAAYELKLDPVTAIRGATSAAASLLRLDDSIGSIRPGLRADLVVVNGNPAEDLRVLAEPRLVMRDGRVLATRGALMGPIGTQV